MPENHILVIFGASGDLTWRKLMPALYELRHQEMLPQRFAVLGMGRSALDDTSFRNKIKEGIRQFGRKEITRDDKIADFVENIYFLSADPQQFESFMLLKNRLASLDEMYGTKGNYIYYLSTPPALYGIIADNLNKAGMCGYCGTDGWKRLIVEKPFGYNLETAKALNKKLLDNFSEDQLYRIDHYLGKETAQNILVTRFFNGFFEPLWNRNYIDRVEITSAESVGVEGRGGYYDKSGALRDMLQNHLLQLVALTAMEPPTVITPTAIRNEFLKVFQSLRPMTEKDIMKNVIRGQYTASVIKGVSVPGYKEEPDVNPQSRTETYVAIKFFIDNWRWGGVPFYIRTGKKLPTRVTEIVIHFKPTPHPHLLKEIEKTQAGNMLIIRIQPDEGILMKFGMKEPGTGFNVKQANLEFKYASSDNSFVLGSYERLIHDCMIGDASLFSRGDAVEAAWEFVDPILKAWETNCDIKLYGYPAGTWGPKVADELMGNNNTWRYPCKNLSDDGLYCEL
ncbi:MAG TPA: glucose-6-phosphate dehydrogenase [Bacteroidales bacterium]|nr:glucose-6-phosphate dehydrogenase [Bacteroidales bacterium]